MSTETKPAYSIPLAGIPLEEMEYICRGTSISEFTLTVSELNYKKLCQVHAELNSRITMIEQQLRSRTTAPHEWNAKASSAASILRSKRLIAFSRLTAMRNNHINEIKAKLGGLEDISSSRLVLIKILVHIIENYCDIQRFLPEEKGILHTCRSIASLDDEANFGTLSYDFIRNSIVSEDGIDIATVNLNGYRNEEQGLRMAASNTMLNLLSHTEKLLRHFAKGECSHNGEVSGTCPRCQAQKIQEATIDLISDLK